MTDEPTSATTEDTDLAAFEDDGAVEAGEPDPADVDEPAEEAETPFGVVGDVPADPAEYDQAFQGTSETVSEPVSAYESAVIPDGSCPDCAAKLHPSSPEHCILCGWDAGSPPKGAVTTDMDLNSHILGKNEG